MGENMVLEAGIGGGVTNGIEDFSQPLPCPRSIWARKTISKQVFVIDDLRTKYKFCTKMGREKRAP